MESRGEGVVSHGNRIANGLQPAMRDVSLEYGNKGRLNIEKNSLLKSDGVCAEVNRRWDGRGFK